MSSGLLEGDRASTSTTGDIMAIQIKKYRVDRWLNLLTSEQLFGVSVQVVGTKPWVRVAEDGKAVILDTMTAARQFIEKMQSERDEHGFKKAQ